jgi:GMP synthase-like glutamine amidotransferase
VPGLVLHNEEEAPPALLADWLERRRIDFVVVRTWEEEMPEDPTRFEWIAALGAEDSVNDREPAWIPAEIDLLRRAVERDVPVLGICFGGQALAAAMGARVGPAKPATIGWYEIETSEPALVPAGPWAHFNFESFSVPSEATLLARSPCGPGAFRADAHLGVQFHPEATPEIVENWIDKEGGRLAAAGIDVDGVRAANRRLGFSPAKQADSLFDAWWAMRLAAPPNEVR